MSPSENKESVNEINGNSSQEDMNKQADIQENRVERIAHSLQSLV